MGRISYSMQCHREIDEGKIRDWYWESSCLAGSDVAGVATAVYAVVEKGAVHDVLVFKTNFA